MIMPNCLVALRYWTMAFTVLAWDCLGLTGIGRKAGNLADSKGNVRTYVGTKVQQHSDNQRIAPNFGHWLSIRIQAKRKHHTQYMIWVALCELHGFKNFINQPALCECDFALLEVTFKFDAQVLTVSESSLVSSSKPSAQGLSMNKLTTVLLGATKMISSMYWATNKFPYE
jgi:hypothetical protein